MRDRKIFPFAIGLSLLVAVVVSAQNIKWADPYRKGLKAFNAHDYNRAVELLEQAVLADSQSDAHKRDDGNFTVPYFPYYYLGVALYELGKYDKAQDKFNIARNGLSRPLLAKLDDYQKRLASATVLARGNGNPIVPLTPSGPSLAFESALQAADAALAAKRYTEAVESFDAAKNADPAEFAKQNAQSRRDEATRGVEGQKLAKDARQLLQEGRLNAAKTKAQQADGTLSGQRAVSDLLAEIKQREDTYQRFKNVGEEDIRGNNFQSALRNFEQAKAADPDLFNGDNLEARIKLVNDRIETSAGPSAPDASAGKRQDSQRQFDLATKLAMSGKYADAEQGFAASVALDPQNHAADDALKKSRRFALLRVAATAALADRRNALAAQRFTEARDIDPERFDREGLKATLERLIKQTAQEPDKITLRNALLALLQGDARKSGEILEHSLARRSSEGDSSAALRAYLGVAYATQALSSAKQDEPTRLLHDKALAQFRLAIAARRDYQLSPRVVSPKIVALFEQARGS